MFYPVADKAVAAAMLALLYVSAVIFVAAFLFAAVELLEPDRRLAIVFKCAILAAGGAAAAKQLLHRGKAPPKLMGTSASEMRRICGALPQAKRFLGCATGSLTVLVATSSQIIRLEINT
jgi:hypothetical protein